MEQKIVQLLTRVEPPTWWTALCAHAALDCEFLTAGELDAHASVIIVPRAELKDLRLRAEALSHSKSYIVVDHGWTSQNLKRALNQLKGALFMDSAQSTEDIAKVVRVALGRQHEQAEHREIMQAMRRQNRQIEDLNQGLEQVVRERTTNEAELRRTNQRHITRMRDIIGFIKELAQLFDIADLPPLVRRHLKEYHDLEAPILFVPRGDQFGDLYHLRASQTIRTRVRGAWIISARIRVNESADSLFLANAMGRPFAKLLRFPLVTNRHQDDPSRAPLIFFEHLVPVGEIEPLLEEISEKLQPVSWALDRLVLEQELKSTSRDWEMTFDELAEPIAILDHDGRVLRSNTRWHADFAGVLNSTDAQFRHGPKLYTVEKYPIRLNESAPPLSWVVYLRDETRSQKLKSQAVQIEKMSAIGQLAGHIAHELNNPLTGIRSLAQVLLTETDGAEQLHQDLQEVEMASARCQTIINNLLDFSKGGLDQKAEMVDLNEIAKRTLPFLKSATGRLRSDVRLAEDELPIKVEPHLMQQVIFNLVNNACQAMPEHGEISVRTRRAPPWAMLEVKDSGPGVPEDLHDRIFEPFFTTKPEGEGTGLGLSLSREFVRQFGGELELESALGHGSLFRVRLPLGGKL